MVHRPNAASAPRLRAPDLPDRLDENARLQSRGDVFQARLTQWDAVVDGTYAEITESVLASAQTDRLDLRGATLIDVEITEPRVAELLAPTGRWRNVRISGGRLGTLDLAAANVDSVELRAVRLDYLSLGQASATDVLIADCTLGTLDVPGATLTRVRFENCRVDEVDTRGLRAQHLDVRGLEALSYSDATALRGAKMTARQCELHAVELASALGITIVD